MSDSELLRRWKDPEAGSIDFDSPVGTVELTELTRLTGGQEGESTIFNGTCEIFTYGCCF